MSNVSPLIKPRMRRARLMSAFALATLVGWQPFASDAQETRATPPAIFSLMSRDAELTAARVAYAQELTVSLRTPGGQDFSQANVGRVVLRSADASHHSIYPIDGTSQVNLSFRPQVPGPALLMTCAGESPDLRGRRSIENNRYCSKIIFEVEAGDNAPSVRPSHAVITAKVGGAVEILPLESPLLKRPGDQMWVRAYLLNDLQPGKQIHAFGPEGEYATYETNRGGNAQVLLTSSGTWTLRYEAEHQGESYVAEVRFVIAGSEVTP